jgi:predicted permease
MDLGIHGDDVLTATVRLPETTYKTFDQGLGFYRQLLEQLRGTAGVNAVAMSTSLPLVAGVNGYITIPGRQAEANTGPLVQATSIDGDYFRAFGIPLLAGREYLPSEHEVAAKFMREISVVKTEAEARELAKKYTVAAVINQSMARAFWPNENAVGKIFNSFANFQVVGIVGDVKQFSPRTLVMPETFYPIEWDMANPNRPYSIVVQGTGKPENFIGELRSAVQGRDASLALMEVRTMPQIVGESMADTQYQTCLLGAMAILALILAAVGTYGVMSYLVRQRTNEIGIRMALGAARGQIVGMVLRQAGMRVAIGIVLGVLAAMAAGRLMTGMLVGVKPIDLPTYVGVAGLLAVVALAACYLPVRSAMRVDPMVALRDE